MARACPALSVTPTPKIARVAPLLLVRSVNATACPLAGLPEPSVMVALTMVLWPAARDMESAVKVMRSPVEAAVLDILVIVVATVVPDVLAWSISWTLVLGEFEPAV
jgi:hypothetical protein